MSSKKIPKLAIYKFMNSGITMRTTLQSIVPYNQPGEGKSGKKFLFTEKQLPSLIHKIKEAGGTLLNEYKKFDEEYSGGSFYIYVRRLAPYRFRLSLEPELKNDEKRFKKFFFVVKNSENPEEVRNRIWHDILDTRKQDLISIGIEEQNINYQELLLFSRQKYEELCQDLIFEGAIIEDDEEPKPEPEKGPDISEKEPDISQNVEMTIISPQQESDFKQEVVSLALDLTKDPFQTSPIPSSDSSIISSTNSNQPEEPKAEEANKSESSQLVNQDGEEEYHETAGIVVYGEEEEQQTPPHTPPRTPPRTDRLSDDEPTDLETSDEELKAPILHKVLKLRGGGGSLPPNLQPPKFDADGNRIEENNHEEEEESEISQNSETKPPKPKYVFLTYHEEAGDFMVGDYHGIQIFIRMSDGYINASALCGQFKTKGGEIKEFKALLRNKEWKTEFYPEFCAEYGRNSGGENSPGHENVPLIVDINAKISKKHQFLRGQYVHPKMINYIAMWASVAHSIYVGKIMDELNELKHLKELENQQLLSHLQDETIAEKERQLQERQLKHDQEIAKIEEEYGEYIHEMEAKFQKQYEEQQKQHEQELDEISEYYQEDIRTIQKRIAEKEAQLEELQDEGEENKALIEELQAEIEDLKIHLEPLLKGKGSFYLFIHQIPGDKFKISVNPQPGTHENRFRKYLFINQTPDEITDKDAQALMKLEFRSLTESRTYAFSKSNLKKVEEKMEELGGVQQAF